MKFKELYIKYKSIIMYLFFGVCTTLVNVISYYFLSHLFKASVMVSTIISWILAVLFAYVTNRKWVFESKVNEKKEIFEEMASFFSCRIGTGLVDWIFMFIFVEKLNFNDVLIKILANIIVIVLNYVASKLLVFNNKNKKIKFKKEYLVYFLFMIMTFVILLLSPSHIWIGKDSSTDSSVFKTIAMIMDNGLFPYLDTFDHKGPLIYIINYLGFVISKNKGIFIFEFISIYFTLYYMYKIAQLKCNKKISFFLSFLAITMLFIFFDGGNVTEEYALPFITSSLYIFLDYIFNKNVNKKRLLLCGLSFGAVLMLRPNMVGTWFIFSIYILIETIKNKEFKNLKKFIVYFLLGTFLLIIPILLWLIINSSFSDFYYDYFVFNKEYSTNLDLKIRIKNIYDTIVTFVNQSLVILSFLITIFMFKKDKKYILYFIYMIVSMILISMSGKIYYHYMIIFIPTIILPFSELFNMCSEVDIKLKNNIVVMLLILFFSISFIFPNWMNLVKEFPNIYQNKNNNNLSNELKIISNIIKKETSVDDKIIVYGNADIYYLYSGRLPATKYSYSYPIINVSNKIKNDYFNLLNKSMPKLIIVQKEDEYIENYLSEKNYIEIYQNQFLKNQNFPKIYKLLK